MTDDSIKIKDPQANLFYGFDWGDWLSPNEIISAHTLSVSASQLVITNDYHTTGSVIFLASGGDVGKRYLITCRIETTGSQIDERTMKIDVKNR